MKIPDGGPAFPANEYSDNTPYNKGMSLRDYFAGQVLPSMFTKMIDKDFDSVDVECVAEWTYEFADAMLEAREKRIPTMADHVEEAEKE